MAALGLGRADRRRAAAQAPLGARRWVLVLLLLLVFTVVRNLPVGAGLAPLLV